MKIWRHCDVGWSLRRTGDLFKTQLRDIKYAIDKFKLPFPTIETNTVEPDCEDNERCYSLYFYHPDHLGSSTYLKDESSIPRQFLLYLPFGETMIDQKAGGYDSRYKYTGKENDEDTGLSYYGARYYDPSIGIFHGVDAWAENYPSWSPYVYTMNNPIRFIDPTGNGTESTHIDEKGKVIAVYNDGDNGVYQHGKNADGKSITTYQLDKRYCKYGTSANGKKVGETLTSNSFVGENGQAIIGAVINLNDNTGQNFIDKEIIEPNLKLLPYMQEATGGGDYDFKTRSIEDIPKDLTRDQFVYRGMKFQGKIASARDVGNYGAGFVAGRNGLSWNKARLGFDALESYQQRRFASEGQTTQLAEKLGYDHGKTVRQANLPKFLKPKKK